MLNWRKVVSWLPITLLLFACGEEDTTEEVQGNNPPEPPLITVGPLNPDTEDDLEVTIIQQSIDPDGDFVLYNYVWVRDGFVEEDLYGNILPASATAKGQMWQVFVIPIDGRMEGDAAIANVTIGNARPDVVLNIEPANPTTLDDVLVEIINSDPDGDELENSIEWSLLNGLGEREVPTDRGLNRELTQGGDIWEISVTPFDGEDNGATVTGIIEISNLIPVIHHVELTPWVPFEDSLFETVVDASDGDGDDITFNFSWSVNGEAVKEGTDGTLSGLYFDRGDEVLLTVTASDATSTSSDYVVEGVLIENTPPIIEAVFIEPDPVTRNSGAHCVPDGAYDSDGDEIEFVFQWLLDEQILEEDSEWIDGSNLHAEGVLVCNVTPEDDGDSGGSVSSEATIVSNSPPSVTLLELWPLNPVQGDDIYIAELRVFDADDDEFISFAYQWYVNGFEVSTETALSGDLILTGDQIILGVTASDQYNEGDTFYSDEIVVSNTVPVITEITLSTETPTTDMVLAALISTEDLEDDPVSLLLSWYVNDELIPDVTGGTLDGDLYFNKYDVIRVTAVPSDEYGEGAAADSDPVTVMNSAPTIEDVHVDPDPVLTGTDANCTAGTLYDADEDPIDVSYNWILNDIDLLWDSESFDLDYFQRGDLLSCSMTVTDGEESTVVETIWSDTVEVANTSPSLTSVSLSMEHPVEGDVIDFTYEGLEDADGDTSWITHAWVVNDVEVSTDETLTSEYFGKHDLIHVAVTTHDDYGPGDIFVSNVIEVLNTVPVITEVSFNLSTIRTDSLLEAVVTIEDVDDDESVTLDYDWYVNGEVVDETGTALDGSAHFERDDVVGLIVTPDDGEALGDYFISDLLYVENSPPTQPGITVYEVIDGDGEGLFCEITGSSYDLDYDLLTYATSWNVGGVPFNGAVSLIEDGDMVPASAITGGEEWQCVVAAFDTFEYGEEAVYSYDTFGWSCEPESTDGPYCVEQLFCRPDYLGSGACVAPEFQILRYELSWSDDLSSDFPDMGLAHEPGYIFDVDFETNGQNESAASLEIARFELYSGGQFIGAYEWTDETGAWQDESFVSEHFFQAGPSLPEYTHIDAVGIDGLYEQTAPLRQGFVPIRGESEGCDPAWVADVCEQGLTCSQASSQCAAGSQPWIISGDNLSTSIREIAFSITGVDLDGDVQGFMGTFLDESGEEVDTVRPDLMMPFDAPGVFGATGFTDEEAAFGQIYLDEATFSTEELAEVTYLEVSLFDGAGLQSDPYLLMLRAGPGEVCSAELDALPCEPGLVCGGEGATTCVLE